MSEEILRGNFKVKKPVEVKEEEKTSSLRQEFKKRALASIGGSMVYMERTDLTWEGDR